MAVLTCYATQPNANANACEYIYIYNIYTYNIYIYICLDAWMDGWMDAGTVINGGSMPKNPPGGISYPRSGCPKKGEYRNIHIRLFSP